MKREDVIPYLVEFMKFLCGFALMLGLSLTLLYFTSSETSAAASSSSAPFSSR